jgi:hypothetical protein
MEDGGTAAVLCERIVRGLGRLPTPALLGLVTPQVRLLRQSFGLTGPGYADTAPDQQVLG